MYAIIQYHHSIKIDQARKLGTNKSRDYSYFSNYILLDTPPSEFNSGTLINLLVMYFYSLWTWNYFLSSLCFQNINVFDKYGPIELQNISQSGGPNSFL